MIFQHYVGNILIHFLWFRCRRCREKLLHYYEQKSKDPKMVIVAVKEFQRSAAGVKAPKSADLRTVGALTRTIEYLILE